MKNPISEFIRADNVADGAYVGKTFERRGLRWVITHFVAETDTHVIAEATLDELADADGTQEIPISPIHCVKVPKGLISE